MRYLLDTNIVVFMLLGEHDSISSDVLYATNDSSSQIYTSSISITEIVHLHRVGKISSKKYKTSLQMIRATEDELNIVIRPFAKEHAEMLAKLEITDKKHNDPADHAIIAHAITDSLTLVSSDTKFQQYTAQGLAFVFNNKNEKRTKRQS